MLKTTFGLIILSFITNSYADNICEIRDFKDQRDKYCIKNPSKGLFGDDYIPTQDFITLVGGAEKFDELFDMTNADGFKKKRKKMMDSFQQMNRDLASNLSDTSSNFKAYQARVTQVDIDASSISQEIKQVTQARKENDGNSFIQAKEEFLKDKTADEKKLYDDVLDDKGNIRQTCLGNSECLKKALEITQYQEEKIKRKKESVAQIKKDKAAFLKKTEKLLDELDGVYVGPFKKNALEEIAKADPSLKGLKTLKEACLKAAKTKSAAISSCEKIAADKNKIENVIDRIIDIQEEMKDTDGPIAALAVKLDLDNLDAKNKKIVLDSTLLEAQKGLEGTVLGHMMDQMREDMCTVATNPKAMCTGSAFSVPPNFVENGSAVAKEVSEEFQNRKVNKSSNVTEQ